MYYLGIGRDFLSVITVNWSFYNPTREMIIPKVMGKVKRGFLRQFRSDRILKIKNRLRADEVEEL